MTSGFDPWAVLREAREKGAGQGAPSISSPISSPISRALGSLLIVKPLCIKSLTPKLAD